MTRTACVALLAWVTACHSSAPAPPTPPPVSSPAPPSEPKAKLVDAGHTPDSSEGSGWSSMSDESPCERACAELYDCVVEQGEQGLAAATTIELGCLEACVPSPAPVQGSLFGCELPSAASEPARCDPFLACVRDAWPERGPIAAPSPAPGPIPVHHGTGCERACWAFAHCEDKAWDPEERSGIALCAQQCSEVLDNEQERRVGQCTQLPDCPEIERCILALPGA